MFISFVITNAFIWPFPDEILGSWVGSESCVKSAAVLLTAPLVHLDGLKPFPWAKAPFMILRAVFFKKDYILAPKK